MSTEQGQHRVQQSCDCPACTDMKALASEHAALLARTAEAEKERDGWKNASRQLEDVNQTLAERWSAMKKELLTLRTAHAAMEDAAHNLLDALNEADRATGYDVQDAQWICGKRREDLQEALAAAQETP